jgi:hypothetical protein
LKGNFDIAFPKILNVNDNQFFVVGGSNQFDFKEGLEIKTDQSQVLLVDMIHQKIIYTEGSFENFIRLHAACGLLTDKGIYIVGGRYQEWSDEAFFYDIQTVGINHN